MTAPEIPSKLDSCSRRHPRRSAVKAVAVLAVLVQFLYAPQVFAQVTDASTAVHFLEQATFGPTALDVANVQAIGPAAWVQQQFAMPESPIPDGLDGRSVVPILKGGTQSGREQIFTEIDYTISGPAKPMRCIQDQRFGYIFNAFSDGRFEYKNNNEGQTFAAMIKAGKTDPAIQARVDMFRHRVVEEFYDLQKDPGCVNNLIDNPEYKTEITKYQQRLREWMVTTGDHNLTAFDARNDPANLAEAVKNYPKMINPTKGDADPSAATDEERATKRKTRRETK